MISMAYMYSCSYTVVVTCSCMYLCRNDYVGVVVTILYVYFVNLCHPCILVRSYHLLLIATCYSPNEIILTLWANIIFRNTVIFVCCNSLSLGISSMYQYNKLRYPNQKSNSKEDMWTSVEPTFEMKEKYHQVGSEIQIVDALTAINHCHLEPNSSK